METAKIITELCSMAGPSGFEDSVALRAKEILAEYMDKVNIDVMGNVIGVKKCGKENAPKLMFDAHIDEIGFIVTGIEEGFLKISTIGGVDPRMMPACEIMLMTEPPIYGIVGTMPPHVLTPKEQEEAVKIEDMFVDIGLSQEEAEKAVPLGTPGVYKTGAVEFGENLICGKTLDDRACFACLVRAAELLKDADLNVDLYIMGSTQEEVGLRGATTGAFSVYPDYAVAVDVCHAKTPDCKTWHTMDLGGGAAIAIGPNMNRAFTKKITDIADEKGLKYQIEIAPGGSSGTNTSVIQTTREGVCTALLSLPLKYMHTPVEVISLDDAESTAQILAELAKAM